MNELVNAANCGFTQSIESHRRQFQNQILSGLPIAVAASAVLLIAGCVPDLREADITQPLYANPLDAMNLESPDATRGQAGSVAADRPGTRYVQARAGDTVATVAERTGIDPAALAEANRIMIDAPLYAGQLIKIPDAPPQTAASQDISRVASTAFETVETGPQSVQRESGSAYDTDAVETTQFAEQVSGMFAAEDSVPLPSAANDPLPEDSEAVALPASPQFSQYQSQETATQFLIPVEGEIIREYSSAPGGNEGIDIAAPEGTVVVAAGDGEVALISRSTDQTAILLIRHPGMLYTVYANLTEIAVEKGDKIARGQPLGKIAGGAKEFLHFEIRLGTESRDPMPYIS